MTPEHSVALSLAIAAYRNQISREKEARNEANDTIKEYEDKRRQGYTASDFETEQYYGAVERRFNYDERRREATDNLRRLEEVLRLIDTHIANAGGS